MLNDLQRRLGYIIVGSLACYFVGTVIVPLILPILIATLFLLLICRAMYRRMWPW